MVKKLFFLFALLPGSIFSQALTNGTTINITKTWSQEPNGYTFPIAIRVPPGPPPVGGFPICILLHGNGGSGPPLVNQFRNVLECHALVAPSGYMGSWNICRETSDAPDIEMVNDLITDLQTYSNINPNQIRILGFSNGSGLANRAFIENTNAGVDIVCTIVSQLNEPQYHAGNFHFPSAQTDTLASQCGYDTQTTPISGRKYLSICNENDSIIPYWGGSSVVGVSFLPAQDAAYIIAQSQGYTGSQLSSTGTPVGSPTVYEYSYLSDQVVHLKGNAAHGINSTQQDYIAEFLNDCSPLLNQEGSSDLNIEVFPNPGSSFIQVKGNLIEPLDYTLTSIRGEMLMEGVLQNNMERIDISELHQALYFLRIGDHSFRIWKEE